MLGKSGGSRRSGGGCRAAGGGLCRALPPPASARSCLKAAATAGWSSSGHGRPRGASAVVALAVERALEAALAPLLPLLALAVLLLAVLQLLTVAGLLLDAVLRRYPRVRLLATLLQGLLLFRLLLPS